MPLKLEDFLADVASVYIGAGANGAFGSGRLIAPGLVLTAGHVVDYPKRESPAHSGWKIRLLRERAKDGTWTVPSHEAELLWRGGDDLDIALVRITDEEKPTPRLIPVMAFYDFTGSIDDVDAAGFPQAWLTETGKLRGYSVRGRLRPQPGPYTWSVPPADKPDDPRGWSGMSGASVCFTEYAGKLYLFGVVQQVPANFSGGMLEVAKISDGMAIADFLSHLQTASGGNVPLVSWAEDSSFGFSEDELVELLEKLRQKKAMPPELAARHEKLAARAALPGPAIASVARHLGVENVPTEDLATAAIDRIDRLHSAQSAGEALPAKTPLKQLVKTAVKSGEYPLAESALDQIRAVTAISEGKTEIAIAALEKAKSQLGPLTRKSSRDDRIVQGYIYKTFEQAYAAKGDKKRANEYLTKALGVFQSLGQELASSKKTPKTITQLANVKNAMGNLRAAQGQHAAAIGDYQMATSLHPTYAFAWHDMFLSYVALAKQGDVRLKEMREALAKTKKTGKGWPQLDQKYFARLDQHLSSVAAVSRPPRSKPSR